MKKFYCSLLLATITIHVMIIIENNIERRGILKLLSALGMEYCRYATAIREGFPE